MSYDTRDLVRRSFEFSHSKGEPDWHRMTLTILKSRMFNLSKKEFDESKHGATNFREFIEQMSDILTIDPNNQRMVEIRLESVDIHKTTKTVTNEDGAEEATIPVPQIASEGEERFADRLSKYINKGDNLGVGELYAEQMNAAREIDEFECMFAKAVKSWASSTNVNADIASVEGLIKNLSHFELNQLAVAVVQTCGRAHAAEQEMPAKLGDLVFQIIEPLRKVYDIEERPSKKKKRGQRHFDSAEAVQKETAQLMVVQSAVTKTENIFSELTEAVRSFKQATAVTARQPSIEVRKKANSYKVYALPGEKRLLNGISVLLDSLFQRFCQSCEHRRAEEVPQRANDLRQYIHRFKENEDYGEDAPHRLWVSVLSPIFEHISTLIEEGTRASDKLISPSMAITGSVFKLDLGTVGRQIKFPAHIQNKGQGKAIGVRLSTIDEGGGVQLDLAEPSEPFDLAAGNERLIHLSVIITEKSTTLSVPVRWTCKAANGLSFKFDQTLNFSQQNVQPNWEELERNTPYPINPIRKKENLYGRDSMLSQLEFNVSSGVSTFLWGQKRVGKTSMLQVLAESVACREDVACIVLRMGEITSYHEGQIAHKIASRLVSELNTKIGVPEERAFGAGLSELIPFVEELAKHWPGKKFLVIIDEFDDLNRAFYTGERGRQFVKALRSLSEVGLTFFFVGSERMQSIYEEHATDLNKWVNLFLDQITEEEDCIALVVEPVRSAIEFDSTAVKYIISYCKGNPFYIHLLCREIFRRCSSEKRTFVGESDIENVRRILLPILGQNNFSHFWEDFPSLDPEEKERQKAQTCLFLTCVALREGSYENAEDLLSAQEKLELPVQQCLTRQDFQEIERQLLGRRIVARTSHNAEVVEIEPPIFRDWVNRNWESTLLPVWQDYLDNRAEETDTVSPKIQISEDVHAFPISEDDILPISQKLVYQNRQKDVAEIRRWLRQFDDDNRIHFAFSLLKRLVQKGFVDDGASVNSLDRIKKCIEDRRLKIGSGAWNIVRRKKDNLCIIYVDSEIKSGASTSRNLSNQMNPGKCGSIEKVRKWMRSHTDSDPLLVIVDDFAGTGNTMKKGFESLWQEDEEILNKLAEEGRILCCLHRAFSEAVDLLKNNFPSVPVLVMETFGDDVRALEPGTDLFADENERKFVQEFLLQIGRQLQPQHPLGYENMGALVAFHNAIPNTTLPVFWSSGTVNGQQWEPLLPRTSFR